MKKGYLQYTNKRMRVLEALKKEENWRPNLMKLSKELRIPMSSIFDIYKKLKRECRFKHTIEVYSDIEMFEKGKE